MIWLLMGILVFAVLLFITKPLYMKKTPTLVEDREVVDYLAQIDLLDTQIAAQSSNNSGDVEALTASKNTLQRALLKHKENTIAKPSAPSSLVLSSIFLLFGFLTLGIYTMIGRPELTKQGALERPTLAAAQKLSQNSDPRRGNNQSLSELLTQLEQKLTGDGNTEEGWTLYARTLMNLGRYDEALIAYEKVVTLTDGKETVLIEQQQAKDYIAQRRGEANATVGMPVQRPKGPNQEQINAAAQMSSQDRAAMIEGMVAQLAQKLEDNSDNPEGWVRLLRARKVLAQTDQAQADIITVREIYKDKPEIISQILNASGWGE
ncbi:MAG: hypothetical protein COA43_03585 [Robiginitomaculum sp.]|nr:MAG: hypothetical protein COA43_03585 [Robiginitomaculum sp.]